MLRRRAGQVAALVVVLSSAASAQKPLTLDDVYDPSGRVNFNGSPATGLT